MHARVAPYDEDLKFILYAGDRLVELYRLESTLHGLSGLKAYV